jgi:hypothetical protein
MLYNPVLSAIVNVLSRSSLNLVDRYTLGVKKSNVYLALVTNTLIPFVIGALLLTMYGSPGLLWQKITSLPCFFLSLIIQVVSTAFSFSFKLWNVRQVVIQAKVADICLSLFFAVAYAFSLFQVRQIEYDWITLLALAISIKSCIPLFMMQKPAFLLHKTSLWIIGSLVVQAIFLSLWKMEKGATFEDAAAISIATLFWRSLFASSIAWRHALKEAESDERLSDVLQIQEAWSLHTLLLRPLAMLLTQSTFIFSIQTGNPLIIFPIINSAPLVSTLLSRLILKEKLLWQDLVAITGFTLSSFLPMGATFLK